MHNGPILRWTTVFLIALLLGLLAIDIAAPWQFLHDDNGAWFSATARTHLVRGLAETKGQDFFMKRDTNELTPYLHHPPFISLYLASVFRITGADSPFVARASFAILHILAFLVFMRLAGLIIGNETLPMLWSIFVFAIVPMSVFFGKMPDHEVPGLLFLELGVLFSLRLVHHATTNYRWLFPMSFAWFLLPLTSWHASFCGLAFILAYTTTLAPNSKRIFLLVSCAAFLSALTLVVIQLLWANNWHFHPSQQTSLQHWIVVPDGENRIAFWFDSFFKIEKHGRKFYGNIPWVLSIGWTLVVGTRLIKRQCPSHSEFTLLSLGIGSMIYCAIFSHAVRIHAYQLFYLLPFVAISSALVIADLYRRLLHYRKPVAIAFVTIMAITTTISSLYRLHRLYGKPDSYAVSASQAIKTQFY